jgi:hypothetical protein
VRLRFVPGSRASSPLELRGVGPLLPPIPDATYVMLLGHAALGDTFPVGHRNEPAL